MGVRSGPQRAQAIQEGDVQKTTEGRSSRWSLGNWEAKFYPNVNAVKAGSKDDNDWLCIESAADCHDLIRVLQEVHCDMQRREALAMERGERR